MSYVTQTTLSTSMGGVPPLESPALTSPEKTTEAIVGLANSVLKLDPPLQESDIDVSHRLAKPKNAARRTPDLSLCVL